MKKLTTLLILFFLSPLVTAQNYSFTYDPTSDFNEPKLKEKSTDVAFLLTVGVPVASFLIGKRLIESDNSTLGGILIAGSIFFAPSAGNMYARNSESVAKGIMTKVLGAGVFVIGGAISLSTICFGDVECPDTTIQDGIAPVFIITGLGIYTYSFIYDIINSMKNVEKYNAKHSPTVEVAPIYYSNHRTTGVGIRLNF